MIHLYKILRGKDNTLKDIFNMSKSVTQGHMYKIKKGKATKSLSINSFSNRVIDDWNNLPATIVTAETLDSFKNKLWKPKMYDTPF